MDFQLVLLAVVGSDSLSRLSPCPSHRSTLVRRVEQHGRVEAFALVVVHSDSPFRSDTSTSRASAASATGSWKVGIITPAKFTGNGVAK